MKKIAVLVFFLGMLVKGMASPVDSISTVYKDGEFVTYSQVWVNASDSTANSVLRDFNYEMCYKLDALFSWALKGMNLRKEKKELMMFYFKSTSYDKQNNIVRGVGDVIVPGFTTIHDIVVDSRLSTRKYPNGKSSFFLNLVNAKGFMKNMNSTFNLVPQKGRGVLYTMETRVKFGWFFDIFITQGRFKQIMEWRLKRFVLNLKEEAERREKQQVRLSSGNIN